MSTPITFTVPSDYYGWGPSILGYTSCFMENLVASYSIANNVITFDEATNEVKLDFSTSNEDLDIVPSVAPY